jgi:hypothetical protein
MTTPSPTPPSNEPSPATPTPPDQPGFASSSPDPQTNGDHTEVIAARRLFWHNVIREMLTSLSAVSIRLPPPGVELPEDMPAEHAERIKAEMAMFDGRLAVLTNAGERIPITRVFPMLACSIGSTTSEKALSMAVQCTVFQIIAPNGETFTLPLHEIRGFHALTDELMANMKQHAHQPEQDEDESGPFGFAAFTSMSRENKEQRAEADG